MGELSAIYGQTPAFYGPMSIPSIDQQITIQLSDGNTIADYQDGVGFTGVNNATTWANQLGIAGSLAGHGAGGGPTINGNGSLTFNGINQFFDAGFVFNQPEMIYMIVNPIVWTKPKRIMDGFVAFDSADIIFDKGGGGGISPNVTQYAGNYGGQDLINFTAGIFHILTVLFNGVNSFLQIDQNAPGLGNAGAINAQGITIASSQGGNNWSNIGLKRLILRNIVDSTVKKTTIQQMLKIKYGTP